MNLRTSGLWIALVVCWAAAAAGCNKPGTNDKKSPPPPQVPANTTDSK